MPSDIQALLDRADVLMKELELLCEMAARICASLEQATVERQVCHSRDARSRGKIAEVIGRQMSRALFR